jgi:hypothetical protein
MASHRGDWHSVSIHEKGRQLARRVRGVLNGETTAWRTRLRNAIIETKPT